MPRSQGTSRKGKPKKNERAAGMGRSLQKSGRRKHTPSASTGGMAMRNGVESINIQQEDNRASVLDVNDLDDFLVQAEMANKEFASQKEQFVMLDSTAQQAIEEEEFSEGAEEGTINSAGKSRDFAFQELSVPRRPAWDESTTPEELDRREKESFLNWRRSIAEKEEEIVLSQNMAGTIGMTPFEKNLEIWRQLWRVMERVSCIVQIVDARNPLFYLSQDLKTYATKELGKPMLLLINKSDYLTAKQRAAWHEYFSKDDNVWEHVFFSAHEQQAILDKNASNQSLEIEESSSTEQYESHDDEVNVEESRNEKVFENVGVEDPLSREELLEWLYQYALLNDCPIDPKYARIPFGMVGFPNVGKSSVINVLMGNAKFAHGVVRVGVAAQPGKTKHFQTLLLPDREQMLLCDCPGLVFPSFVNNTADLIVAGVYPIAQMRDPWPVVNLLCRRIPRQVLNAQYGIHIPMPTADAMLAAPRGKIPPPTAEEFLTTYCVARSMLASSSGVPDFQRAARIVIKEYAAGKLLYCHAPPDFEDGVFQAETMVNAIRRTVKLREKLAVGEELGLSNSISADAVAADGADLDDDALMLELMGGVSMDLQQKPMEGTGKPGRQKRWGKKGRKLRNKDPYGCHSNPDESLGGGAEGSVPLGVSVQAGKKNSRKNYVRPTGYGLARTAMS